MNEPLAPFKTGVSGTSPPPRGEPADPSPARAPVGVDFEALFREMSPQVLRVIPRMGIDAADVDDVAQEVFLAVHRGLASFEGRSSLRTWVYGICLRVCASYRRKAFRRRERPVPEPEPVPDGLGEDPERSVGAQRALRALDRALGELSEDQRAVFVLFEIEQVSMVEIARLLGASKFTTYGRLYAARKYVRRALAAHHEGDDHGP